MAAVKNLFVTFLKRRPLLANCLTYGTLYVGAEFSQQFFTYKVIVSSLLRSCDLARWLNGACLQPKPPEDLDKPTLLRYAIMGTCFYSPILYNWYKWLDGRYIGIAPKIIMKKLLLDQFLLTPPLIVIFYIGMAAMEGNPLVEELQSKGLDTFIKSCYFWIPVQLINFVFVPPHIRITYMGMSSLAWVNILCWVKRQKFDRENPQHQRDDKFI